MQGIGQVFAALACAGMLGVAQPASAQAGTAASAPGHLATVTVKAANADSVSAFEGVVEAVRQSVIAAQVPGAVVELAVKAGDRVKAGQVLARLDARAALQTAAAGDAQVRAARAELEAATREVERQRALFGKQYISQAALDRAEAQFKSTGAQVAAQLAQAGASRTQSGFYVLTAPYAGVVADVSVVMGEMAMPGRALMTLYDPAALRVTAPVPQAVVARLGQDGAVTAVRIELPGLPAERASLTPVRLTVLPSADPNTHTVPVRFDLATAAGVTPGMFARVWLPGERSVDTRVFVPAASVLRRAEMRVVYVLDAGGKPVLRQVRLGRVAGDNVEVLAGVAVGERVVLDPQAAAQVR